MRWLLLSLAATALPATAQRSTGRTIAGEEVARQQVREAVRLDAQSNGTSSLLPDKASAVAVAEALASQAYGRRHIRSERPYEAYLIDGYWYIAGTLPRKYTRGGTFEVILAAHDGRVLLLTHGR